MRSLINTESVYYEFYFFHIITNVKPKGGFMLIDFQYTEMHLGNAEYCMIINV